MHFFSREGFKSNQERLDQRGTLKLQIFLYISFPSSFTNCILFRSGSFIPQYQINLFLPRSPVLLHSKFNILISLELCPAIQIIITATKNFMTESNSRSDLSHCLSVQVPKEILNGCLEMVALLSSTINTAASQKGLCLIHL